MKPEEDVVWPTHARFAAQLLSDCRTELLSISTVLDRHVEDEEYLLGIEDPDLQNRRRLSWHGDGFDAHIAALVAYQDKPKLVAAAAYAQWISDYLKYVLAEVEEREAAVVAQFAYNSDQLALLQHRNDGSEQLVLPCREPPPFPAPLEEPDSFRVNSHTRLDPIRDMLDEAAVAVGRSTTTAFNNLSTHVAKLAAWLPPPSPPAELGNLLAKCRQQLWRIGDRLDDADPDKANLKAGALYLQWIADEERRLNEPTLQPWPNPGEPAPLGKAYGELLEAQKCIHESTMTAARSHGAKHPLSEHLRSAYLWAAAPTLSDWDGW